jgi:hypothetical protein
LWSKRSLEILSKVLLSLVYKDWIKASDLIPQVEVITNYLLVFHLLAYELGILFTLAGSYFRAKSQYTSTGDYIIRAIRTLSAALGPEDPITMKTRHCLVHICHGADRYEEAEDIFRVLISYYSYNTGEVMHKYLSYHRT